MIRTQHPVEELYQIRAEIGALQARETELRRFFLEHATAAERIGPQHQVTLVTQQRRVFDRTALPDTILEDPRVWRNSKRRMVKVIRRTDATAQDRFGPAISQFWRTPDPDDDLFGSFQ